MKSKKVKSRQLDQIRKTWYRGPSKVSYRQIGQKFIHDYMKHN